MILVQDQAQADLGAPELTCPHCPGQLRRWGVRPNPLAALLWWWTRVATTGRVRCASCKVTHVLLPALAPPHRAYTIDVVGAALLASAGGQSHRAIGADLGVPPDTVRDWIRRVKARAEWLRVQGTIRAHMLDPMLPVIVPAGSALADALSALATAAAAFVRRLGPTAPPWQLIAMIARGQLLAPVPSG